MSTAILNKKSLINHLEQLLEQKITKNQEQITSLKESRDSDTKNSAGDKYETGVEMIQQEIENTQQQLNQFKKQQQELHRARGQNASEVISFGNLVLSSQGLYFLAIGLGEIKVDGQSCYCISTASPLGSIFLGKKKGDKVHFKETAHRIEAIV